MSCRSRAPLAQPCSNQFRFKEIGSRYSREVIKPVDNLSNVQSTEHPVTSMQHMPICERPYEKLDRVGVENLTNAELLAIIIRTGKSGQNVLTTAKQLLYSEGGSEGVTGSLHRLISLTPEEMMACPGIGPVKTRQILATLELGKRLCNETSKPAKDLSSPEAVVSYIGNELRFQAVEEAHILMTDCRNQLIRSLLVSRGGVTSTSLHPREVFREAIRANATGVIIVHNHPSGFCEPSKSDIQTTIRLCKAGLMIGIPINDHIIVTTNSWISMRRETDIWDQL